MKDVWTLLKDLLPLFAAALLVASIAYDYGFLDALNLSFTDIPSTISDHVRSAIVWVPIASLAFFLYIAIELFIRRIEGGRTEEEIIAEAPNPKFTKKFRKSGDHVFLGGAILAAALAPFLSTDSGWIYFSLMVFWICLTLSVLSHARLGKSFDSRLKTMLLIVPVLILMVGMQGHMAGSAMKRASEPSWEITLKSDVSNPSPHLLGIRRFSSFSVAVTADQHAWIVPNELIISIRDLKGLETKSLNVCRWWHIMCLKEENGDSAT